MSAAQEGSEESEESPMRPEANEVAVRQGGPRARGGASLRTAAACRVSAVSVEPREVASRVIALASHRRRPCIFKCPPHEAMPCSLSP